MTNNQDTDFWSTTNYFSGPESGWVCIMPANAVTIELRERLQNIGCRYDRIAHFWYAPNSETANKAHALAHPWRR